MRVSCALAIIARCTYFRIRCTCCAADYVIVDITVWNWFVRSSSSSSSSRVSGGRYSLSARLVTAGGGGPFAIKQKTVCTGKKYRSEERLIENFNKTKRPRVFPCKLRIVCHNFFFFQNIIYTNISVDF